jgi:hypothetical protein
MESSPLNRTIAIAPSPIGVEIAAIVSNSITFTTLYKINLYKNEVFLLQIIRIPHLVSSEKREIPALIYPQPVKYLPIILTYPHVNNNKTRDFI